MSNPAQLERALSEALDRFTDSFKALLTELHHSGPATGATSGPGTAAVCAGFDRIANAANQTDIMQALLDASEAFSGRCALLVVKGEKLACWRTRGIDDAAVAALRGLDLAADGPSGWKQAVDGTGPISDSMGQLFFQKIGIPSDKKAYLLPLMVRERPVAVLYADAGAGKEVDYGVLTVFKRAARMCLELSTGRPKAEAPAAATAKPLETPTPAPPPPPAPPVVAEVPPPPPPAPVVQEAVGPAPPTAARPMKGPDLTNVPAEDQEIHKKAYRFAKLLVDELMLYNKDKVAQGKKIRDVYSLLQEDIDKSRLAYDKKFGGTAAGKVDYFHQQMVQQLGDSDPSAIGSGYPGPLV